MTDDNEVSKSDALTNVVLSGLRQTIEAHGPITLQWIGSAAKRITGSMLSLLTRAREQAYDQGLAENHDLPENVADLQVMVRKLRKQLSSQERHLKKQGASIRKARDTIKSLVRMGTEAGFFKPKTNQERKKHAPADSTTAEGVVANGSPGHHPGDHRGGSQDG